MSSPVTYISIIVGAMGSVFRDFITTVAYSSAVIGPCVDVKVVLVLSGTGKEDQFSSVSTDLLITDLSEYGSNTAIKASYVPLLAIIEMGMRPFFRTLSSSSRRCFSSAVHPAVIMSMGTVLEDAKGVGSDSLMSRFVGKQVGS